MSLVSSYTTGNLVESCRSFIARSARAPRVSHIIHLIIGTQILVLAAVWFQSAVPLERLFRDTIAVAEDYPGCCHVYDGLISNLGILLWWTTATVTGFTALAVANLSSRTYEALAFAMAAAFSAWLTLDDLFMLHESVLPLTGLTQPMIYAVYGAIAVGYIGLSSRVVFAAAPRLMYLAILMLGVSVGVDVFADHNLGPMSDWLHANPRAEVFLDDGFKFLGIGFWCCLHLAAAMSTLANTVDAIALKRIVQRGFHSTDGGAA